MDIYNPEPILTFVTQNKQVFLETIEAINEHSTELKNNVLRWFFMNNQSHDRIRTCAGIHGATVTDYETVLGAVSREIKEGVLDLEHCLNQVFLELESCKKKRDLVEA